MRPARAYLTGFGTTGSLLAGAAVLFVLGTAVVTFRGWPTTRVSPPARVVINAPIPVSRAARRLAGAVRVVVPARSPNRPQLTRATAARRLRVRPGSPSVVTEPPSASGAGSRSRTGSRGGSRPSAPPGTQRPAGAQRPTGSPTTCTQDCGGGGSSTPRKIIARVSHGAARVSQGAGSTVTQVGAKLGATVVGVTGTIGGSAPGSPGGPGGVVSEGGQRTGQAISGTSATVGGLVGGA